MPNERASIQMWRETLNDHGRVMWGGQVTGHMSSLASYPAALTTNAVLAGLAARARDAA